MAAPMRFRVRLNLQDLNIIAKLDTWKYWYNVESDKVATIEDLANDVITSFCSNSLSVPLRVQLHLDGFVLPGWESTHVLRENDEIKFTVTSRPNLVSPKHSKSVALPSKRKIKTAKGKPTKKIKENLTDGDKKKIQDVAHQRKKKNESNNTNNAEETSSSSSESESSDEETEKSKSLEKKFSANPPTKAKTKSTTIGKPVDANTTQKKKAINPAKKVDNSSSESDSDRINESKEESKTPKLNSENKNTTSIKNTKAISAKNHDNTSSSSESEDEFKKNAKSVVNTILNETPLKPAMDYTSIQKERKETEVKALPDSLNTEIQKSLLTVGAVVEGMKKKRTRRGKTRCRPKKKNMIDKDQVDSNLVDYDKWQNTQSFNKQYETVQDVSLLDDSIVSITPVSPLGKTSESQNKQFGSNNFKASKAWKEGKYRNSYNGGGKHMKFNSDNENEDIEGNGMECEDQVAPGNQVPASLQSDQFTGKYDYHHSLRNTGDVKNQQNYAYEEQRNVETTGIGSDGTELALEVQGGIPVFTRAKRLNKKKASFPLSEAQQLSNQVQHKSFTFEDTDSGEQVMKPKVDEESNQDESFSQKQTPEEPEPKVVPKDYSQFELLHGIPRIGDNIAYKILEVSESYSPEVSDYKEALVIGYDPITQMVELEVTFAKAKTKLGRFDCFVESGDEVLTNYQNETGKRVQLSWTSLIEPRLLKDETKMDTKQD